jgi:general secretion pathway protein D
MHIKVEVSSVTSTETIGGIQQPIIGQRVNEADLRMEDGEASLLGGLTSDSDTQSVAGIPGIANIPVLGYLFGTHTKDREKDDIVIALIPHIVRAPVVNNNDEGILAGTERIVKVDRRTADQPATPLVPAVVPNQPPVPNNPANPPAPTQLPPLGRVLELPPGVIPGQSTASGAYMSNASSPISPQMRMASPAPIPNTIQFPPGTIVQQNAQPNPANPGQSNSIEIYLSPKPDPTAGPQAAQDPVNTPPALAPGRKPMTSNRRPIIDPDAPLELTSVVVTDNSSSTSNSQPAPASSSSQQQ